MFACGGVRARPYGLPWRHPGPGRTWSRHARTAEGRAAQPGSAAPTGNRGGL